MDDIEVDEFLTKVIKEESFNFNNPEETIYWYCFHNGLRYSKAKQLLESYEGIIPAKDGNQSLWMAMQNDPKLYVLGEDHLKKYLSYLKAFRIDDHQLYEEYISLYDRVRMLIVEIYNLSDNKESHENEYSIEDIGPGIVEKVLYTEIPMNSDGNFVSMSASILSRQFLNKRMSRQHMSNILKGKAQPDRYDLLTLLFFIYSHSVYYENDDGSERFRDYIDEMNSILNRCHLSGVYPVNPYEAFLLMCLATEDPLESYYDVWRLSYEKM